MGPGTISGILGGTLSGTLGGTLGRTLSGTLRGTKLSFIFQKKDLSTLGETEIM